ncbi:unnamed protein product [Schistosoma margrebowiei]|uniref:Uncharacterized protein n=1 Tax=Schistosoma margrebowiei TaxID=48269 RepID=A0A183LY67_9TREM|nr:unnamed protein product [Schistosoma margrebowiei]
MYIQQIGYVFHNISTQVYEQSYMDLNGPHYGEPDRSYMNQQYVPRDNGRCGIIRGAGTASDHHLVVASLKLKTTKHWTTGGTALQRFNTAFLRNTNKLNQFKITLNNRFRTL